MRVRRRHNFVPPLQSTRPTWPAILAVATVLAGVVVLLWFVDPGQVNWLPKCPLHLLTGWHCPGCGATRMVHALVHGDLARAFTSNALLVMLGPALVVYSLWRRLCDGPGWTSRVSPRAIWALAAVLLVFAVLRNVPVYPFQLLAPH